MKKYVFKPYYAHFPLLFAAEKMRIIAGIQNNFDVDYCIEHVGSTAVPDLGGKGIIDSAVAIKQPALAHATREAVSQVLIHLGYVFKEQWSTPERLFFRADLPDQQEGVRRYHVHVMPFESGEWNNLIAFRDYLRANLSEAQRYAELKKNAVMQADGEGAVYRKLKEPLFADVLKKIKETI